MREDYGSSTSECTLICISSINISPTEFSHREMMDISWFIWTDTIVTQFWNGKLWSTIYTFGWMNCMWDANICLWKYWNRNSYFSEASPIFRTEIFISSSWWWFNESKMNQWWRLISYWTIKYCRIMKNRSCPH
jgi:hypothetical protein